MFRASITGDLTSHQVQKVTQIIRSSLVQVEWAHDYAPRMKVTFQKPRGQEDDQLLCVMLRYRLGSRNPSITDQLALIQNILQQLHLRRSEYTQRRFTIEVIATNFDGNTFTLTMGAE